MLCCIVENHHDASYRRVIRRESEKRSEDERRTGKHTQETHIHDDILAQERQKECTREESVVQVVFKSVSLLSLFVLCLCSVDRKKLIKPLIT